MDLWLYYQRVDVFLLILVRILAFFLAAPVFSSSNIAGMVKIGLASAVSFLIFTSGQAEPAVSGALYTESVPGFFLLVISEFMIGFTAGFTVSMAFNLVLFAGQLLDFQIGFSMVSVFDPVSQIQVPIVGNLLNLTVTALLVQSGGLHALLSALFFSYEALPIGHAFFTGNGRLIWRLLETLMSFMSIAVQICIPIVGALLIIDISMGLLVKAVPQMNVFVVGMPIKLLAGLLLLAMLTPMFSGVYQITFEQAMKALTQILKGMSAFA
ncbi:MAG: flagellar biosynthetic protein FliR [Clostridiales bacterium]|jgi:flagellar biosynthetic protein FliR|nr:flagellar biosynthetic protein FliR [Clostridiales bacterium]